MTDHQDEYLDWEWMASQIGYDILDPMKSSDEVFQIQRDAEIREGHEALCRALGTDF